MLRWQLLGFLVVNHMGVKLPDEKTSKAEVIAKSVEKVSNSKGIEAVGYGIGWGVAALAVSLILISINLRDAAMKWDGHIHAETKCFEIKEVSGKVYRLNSCTGESEELPSEGSAKTEGVMGAGVQQPGNLQGAASAGGAQLPQKNVAVLEKEKSRYIDHLDDDLKQLAAKYLNESAGLDLSKYCEDDDEYNARVRKAKATLDLMESTAKKYNRTEFVSFVNKQRPGIREWGVKCKR